MPFLALTYAAYRTDNFTGDQAEFHANKFIKAIKGETLNGYAWIPTKAGLQRLAQWNRGMAAAWFGELAAEAIRERVDDPIVLVPIPNSDCVISQPASKGVRLAREIQKHIPCEIWDGLRWEEPNIPAHRGGPRFAHQLFPNLRIVGNAPRGEIVLVDDVKTSGGHFQAAAALLAQRGAPVILAIAAGQTEQYPVDTYFGWKEHVVEDYVP